MNAKHLSQNEQGTVGIENRSLFTWAILTLFLLSTATVLFFVPVYHNHIIDKMIAIEDEVDMLECGGLTSEEAAIDRVFVGRFKALIITALKNDDTICHRQKPLHIYAQGTNSRGYLFCPVCAGIPTEALDCYYKQKKQIKTEQALLQAKIPDLQAEHDFLYSFSDYLDYVDWEVIFDVHFFER